MSPNNELENPVLGYVVVTVALLVGILSASVFGGIPLTHSGAAPTDRGGVIDGRPPQSRFELPAATPILARRWVLGVRTEATSAGCVVSELIPQSAAERAGLAVGDRIVAVDGDQVGWVGKRLEPLHEHVDRSVSGRAQLLVQRAHCRALVMIPVRLTRAEEVLGH